MAKAPAKVSAFKEAVEFWRSRVPMTDAGFKRLSQRAQDKAFTIAGVAQLDLVADVWKALDKAVEQGTTFQQFKKDVGESLTSAWGGEKPGRLETVFRTNVQTAYSAGRWEQLTNPEIAEVRPFFRYVAILDPRTTSFCRSANGTVLPQSHPFWRNSWPPSHFRCRATVLAVTEDQASELGIGMKPLGGRTPAPGFGKTPDQKGWEPDLTEIPEALVKVRDPRR